MINEEKLKRMEHHLENHPNDYQTAISLLIDRSKEIDYQRKKRQNDMRKQISLYKENENGK